MSKPLQYRIWKVLSQRSKLSQVGGWMGGRGEMGNKAQLSPVRAEAETGTDYGNVKCIILNLITRFMIVLDKRSQIVGVVS